MDKKGVSDVLVTVLIIGFTIALAAVIIVWGQGFTKSVTKSAQEKNDEATACIQDVNFLVNHACVLDANSVKVTLANNDNKRIENFMVRYHVSADNIKTDSLTGLNAFDVATLTSINLAGEGGDVKLVEVFPTIKINDQLVTCSDSVETFGDKDVINGQALAACS